MGLGRLSFVSLIVAVGVGAVPSAALAAQPERFHDHFLDVEDDIDVCGINVDIAVSYTHLTLPTIYSV